MSASGDTEYGTISLGDTASLAYAIDSALKAKVPKLLFDNSLKLSLGLVHDWGKDYESKRFEIAGSLANSLKKLLLPNEGAFRVDVRNVTQETGRGHLDTTFSGNISVSQRDNNAPTSFSFTLSAPEPKAYETLQLPITSSLNTSRGTKRAGQEPVERRTESGAEVLSAKRPKGKGKSGAKAPKLETPEDQWREKIRSSLTESIQSKLTEWDVEYDAWAGKKSRAQITKNVQRLWLKTAPYALTEPPVWNPSDVDIVCESRPDNRPLFDRSNITNSSGDLKDWRAVLKVVPKNWDGASELPKVNFTVTTRHMSTGQSNQPGGPDKEDEDAGEEHGEDDVDGTAADA